ncbi:mitochondrial import receptor subunit TOM20 homolog [Bubalus bubalis]|uniref:mitochondrial import receptor subunit TOM20 homolog n=1 Tax=Bubalus bubalis TaxID=89462 RepID=UPI000DBC4ACE|nr:mitochondrial import receptor subunit TOM20 homolog [Bubalus bubalis]XP_045020247.1 mitochondrial import receptor subunit TOM20 homolog [Bubalus bubalis]
MVGRNSAIAAGVCGALFIGYCIYFDRKRRSDPNFKDRLRERRKKQKLAKERAGLSKLPDLKDAEAVQKFFLEEIQLGEGLLAQGRGHLHRGTTRNSCVRTKVHGRTQRQGQRLSGETSSADTLASDLPAFKTV